MRHEGKDREDFLFYAPSMAMIYVLNFYNLISMAMTVSSVWSDVWSYSRFVFLSLLNSGEIVVCGLVWLVSHNCVIFSQYRCYKLVATIFLVSIF